MKIMADNLHENELIINDESINLFYSYNIMYEYNGDILVYGYNSCGQLGLGHCNYVTKPTFLMNGKTIKNIVHGGLNTFIYKEDGDVLSFGNNLYGQLGVGSNESIINIPTSIFPDKTKRAPIKNICCGGMHTIIYRDDGKMLIFGNNKFGQLGIDQEIGYNVNLPILLMNDKTIKTISCGLAHTIIYRDNGDILSFGKNNYGQLGIGHNRNMYKPTLLVNDKSIKTIICNKDNTIIYKDNGELLVFGDNTSGQLGLGHTNNANMPTLLMKDKTIKNIILYAYSLFIYKYNGELLVSGDNLSGKLGLGHDDNVSKLTLLLQNKSIKNIVVSDMCTIMYSDNGDVLFSGRKNKCENIFIPTTIINNPYLKSIAGIKIIHWSIENYKDLSILEQERIRIFYYCLKKIQIITGIIIPKFVIYEVLKFI